MNFFTRVLLLMSTLTLVTLSLQASLSVTETHENVSCFGGNDGSIDITVSGSDAPYTYLWNNGITTEDRTNLAAGTYTLTVTDNLGVSVSVSVTISQPTAITTSRVITDVYCGGDSTGAVDFTVLGGTPGYTYLWSNGATSQDITDVPAANYYITITDANGCIKVDSADVIQPPGMVISKSITNATCNSSNGAINLTVQFGIPGYTFLWNDGITSEDRTGLPVGTYTVTITDNSGCEKVESATVNQAPGAMSINRIFQNPTCAGSANGSISITAVIGSVGPYTYTWNDGATAQNRVGLGAGNYSVTATSSVGCTASATISLTEPTPLNVSLNTIPVSCNGGNNGAIITSVSGGTAPYAYLWDDGAFTQNRTSLATGNYTVTVTDNRTCTATATAYVAQPMLALTATAIPSPLACIGGPTGSVLTTVSGGTAPYSYWWGGAVVTPNLINVVSGTYTVTATDANGCTAVASATIPSYNPMNAAVTQITHNSCYGGNRGAIDISVADGSLPYTFLWSNGATTEDVDSLGTGTYSVIITDQHTCIVTLSGTINQPNPDITINSTVTDVTCFGYGNGAISINAVNGASPYTYLWADGVDSVYRSSLAPGNYSVTATDANLCSASLSIAVSEPTQLNLIPVVNDVLCYGDSSGSISLSVTGSFPPYTYQWNEGGTTQNRTNLPIGNYSVTVVDNHLCSATTNAVVSQSDEITFLHNVTHASCYGEADGSMSVSVSGGHQPYLYNWSAGGTGSDIQNLNAGVYTLTVEDSVGCIELLTDTVKEPQEMVINSVITDAGCGGMNTGAIGLTIAGGQWPFSFEWDNGDSTQNRSGLPSGTYSVIVTDSAGCTAAHIATVGQSSDIVVSVAVTDVSCYGGSNGAIDVDVANGIFPYGFEWSDGFFQQDRAGIAAGNYSVTITDNTGCSTVETVTVNESAPTLVSTTVTNASCNGGNNGTIQVIVSGIAPFAFDWGNNDTTQNRVGLAAGTYTVTVTDDLGCSVESSATVYQSGSLTVLANVTEVLCYGDSTGGISVSVSGGVAPYNLDWGGGIGDSVRNNLSAGIYNLTVSDAASCSLSYSFEIEEATQLQLATSATNVSCYGMNDGEISTIVSGGVIPYSYVWSDGDTLANRAGLLSGVYEVTVIDANACDVTAMVVISEPSQLTVSVSHTNVSCANEATGTVSISSSGGTGFHSFEWNDGSTDAVRSSLGAGTYIFTVSDINNCTISDSVIITEPSPIVISLNMIHPLCYGDSTGSIVTTVSGGMGGYTYLWSTGASTNQLVSVPSGIYHVSIQDGGNCEISASAIINEPIMLTVSETHTNVSCNAGNDGTIDITANGSGTLQFQWNTGQVSEDRTNLPAGIYEVTVTDSNSCTASLSVEVTEPDALFLSESHTHYHCAGTPGAIDLSVTGGTAPYSYSWSNTDSTQDIYNLVGGTYSVVVTDNNSCSATLSVAVSSAPPLNVMHAKTDLICHGTNNGSIDLSVSGGTAPYNFLWSNGSVSEDLLSVPAGTYSVVITDSANCTASASEEVTQPDRIEVSQSITHVRCFGDGGGSVDLSVSGGVSPYAVVWSTFDSTMSLSSLYAGTYTALVNDANGCVADSVWVLIEQPQALLLSADVTPISCVSRTDGSINLNVSGGRSPYAYLWNNQSSVPDMSHLSTGTYSATVTDANGCVDSIVEVIDIAPPLQIMSSVQNTPCAQVQKGIIDLSVTGGTPSYTYQWNDLVQGEDRINLSDGHYAVTVTDSRGCSVQSAFVVHVDYDLQIEASPSVTISLGESANLSGTVSADHANTYSWTPAVDIACNSCLSTSASPRMTTLYTISVADENGCVASDTTTVTVETMTDFFLPNVFTPNKDGANDTWEMYGRTEGIAFLDVMLFNRWGEKVFSSNNHHFAWDGTYQGEDAPPGVYVYAMKVVFANGESRNDIKGSVTLLR